MALIGIELFYGFWLAFVFSGVVSESFGIWLSTIGLNSFFKIDEKAFVAEFLIYSCLFMNCLKLLNAWKSVANDIPTAVWEEFCRPKDFNFCCKIC